MVEDPGAGCGLAERHLPGQDPCLTIRTADCDGLELPAGRPIQPSQETNGHTLQVQSQSG